MSAPRLPVPLTDEMRAFLEEESRRRGCSQAQVVRDLIAREMRRQKKEKGR